MIPQGSISICGFLPSSKINLSDLGLTLSFFCSKVANKSETLAGVRLSDIFGMAEAD